MIASDVRPVRGPNGRLMLKRASDAPTARCLTCGAELAVMRYGGHIICTGMGSHAIRFGGFWREVEDVDRLRLRWVHLPR